MGKLNARDNELSKDVGDVAKSGYVKNDVRTRVPYDSLTVDKHNPRKTIIQKDVEDLAKNIRLRGLKYPLDVIELEKGKYAITAGQRRWLAIGLIRESGEWDESKLDPNNVPVIVYADHARAREIGSDDNDFHKSLTPVDRQANYERLAGDQYGKPGWQKWLSEHGGYDAGDISRCEKLKGVHPLVLKLERTGKVTDVRKLLDLNALDKDRKNVPLLTEAYERIVNGKEFPGQVIADLKSRNSPKKPPTVKVNNNLLRKMAAALDIDVKGKSTPQLIKALELRFK